MKKIITAVIAAFVVFFAVMNFAEETEFEFVPEACEREEESTETEVIEAPEVKDDVPQSAAEQKTPEVTPPLEEELRPESTPEAVHTCTLSVRCDTILDNIADIEPEKLGLVPSDGVILEERTVEFNEGESVFHILRRETRKNGIHMEFVNTPMYNSAYIEGIGNLYEFDCGELSGWMYRVNGEFPNYGCSRYILKDGDRVEWVYTCDLGKDVGETGGISQYE